MHPWSFSSKWETRKVTAGKYTCLRLLLGLQSVILFVIALEMACHKSNYQLKKKSTIRNMGVGLGKGGRRKDKYGGLRTDFIFLTHWDGFQQIIDNYVKKKKSILWSKKWLPSWLLLAIQETWVSSLGQEDPLEKEMATHSSILAQRIPWTGQPGGLQSSGLQSRTWLSGAQCHEVKKGSPVLKRR